MLKTKILEGCIMEDIKERLAHILRAKNLTASQFAELMEIQPSNVSHLLNGRNKPSLEFLIKLKNIFPEYSFDWIILGKKPITNNDPNPAVSNNQDFKFEIEEEKQSIIFDDNIEQPYDNQIQTINNKKVAKIYVIYTDNTFEVLNPAN